MRYQVAPRLWIAGGSQYGSGLPVAFECSAADIATCQAQAAAQYGPAVVDRVNFDRGRVRSNLSVDVSAGADIYKSDRLTLQLQADGQNLNNRLNVLDFAGLFSGNAIGPPRSYTLRLTANF
jgi:hypothetical protein